MVKHITPRLNRRVAELRASGIRRIVDAAAHRDAAGQPVYAFHLGEPDFDTPEPIKKAAIAKLQEGQVHYTPNAGIPELRSAVAHDLYFRYQASVDPSQVLITVGSCEALSLALLAVLDVGDEVLVPTPCWPNYLQLPKLIGAHAIQVPLAPNTGFSIDPAQLEQAITPRTRALLINSPNNPTGNVISRSTLETLIELARSYGLWLIIDEIYQDIVFDGAEHISPFSLVRPGDPLIHIGGFSKSYAMTGWRIGYAVAMNDAFSAMLKAHQYLVTSATSFVQWGALEALSQAASRASMRNTYQLRYHLVEKALEQAGFRFTPPQGAFYVFARIPDAYPNSEAFCLEMLTEHGLGFVPGDVFGDAHADHFRLCFACATDELRAGLQKLSDIFHPSSERSNTK